MKRILVFGSLNIDLVQRLPRMPVPGETLQGSDIEIFVGGKGANQACAAALMGGKVRMIGKVGSDVFADRLVHEIGSVGVDVELVGRSGAASGSATIFVLPNGENAIVISPGANADISDDFALSAVAGLEEGDLLLCQLETPLTAVQAAMTAAHKKRVLTILDPAPARDLPDDLLASTGLLTPNQTEAAALLSLSEPPRNFEEAETVARKLQARGAARVIIKMGALGCLIADGNTVLSSAGFRVEAKDTTGAGDTFNGALAAGLGRGATLTEAAHIANAAAALSVMKPGAINSMPNSAQVQQFIASARPTA